MHYHIQIWNVLSSRMDYGDDRRQNLAVDDATPICSPINSTNHLIDGQGIDVPCWQTTDGRQLISVISCTTIYLCYSGLLLSCPLSMSCILYNYSSSLELLSESVSWAFNISCSASRATISLVNKWGYLG